MASVIQPELVLEFPVPPLLNSKYQITKTGRFYVNKDHKRYVEEVHKKCVSKRIKPILGEIGVIIVWYRKSKRGDIDSPIKTLLDSLNGFAYKDDSQICEMSIFRVDSQPENPRVVVKIIDLFNEETFTIEDD